MRYECVDTATCGHSPTTALFLIRANSFDHPIRARKNDRRDRNAEGHGGRNGTTVEFGVVFAPQARKRNRPLDSVPRCTGVLEDSAVKPHPLAFNDTRCKIGSVQENLRCAIAYQAPPRSLWITACDPSGKPSAEAGQLHAQGRWCATQADQAKAVPFFHSRQFASKITGMGRTPGTLFDVASWSGLDLRHIPTALRDEHGFADTRSWAAYFSDATLARLPQELVFGTLERFGKFFGVSGRQARDIMTKGHFHRCGGFRITTVNSVRDVRRRHESHISNARAEAGRRSGEARAATATGPRFATDQSSGGGNY